MNEKITLGGGCFWCTEAVYLRIPGVVSVVSGYAGGTTKNPTYREICTGTTGHAEVIQVSFDPQKTNLTKILDVFWLAHDPTTLNRQGNDIGTQYRSVVFYHDENQKEIALESKRKHAFFVPVAHRDRDFAFARILSGRRLPPKLFCTQSIKSVLQFGDSTQTKKIGTYHLTKTR